MGGRGRFLGDHAVFAEDVVPGSVLAWDFRLEGGERIPFCVGVWVVYGDTYALFYWSCHFVLWY
jgi:hypothetical protein